MSSKALEASQAVSLLVAEVQKLSYDCYGWNYDGSRREFSRRITPRPFGSMECRSVLLESEKSVDIKKGYLILLPGRNRPGFRQLLWSAPVRTSALVQTSALVAQLWWRKAWRDCLDTYAFIMLFIVIHFIRSWSLNHRPYLIPISPPSSSSVKPERTRRPC